jgi:hypothetical protein
LGPVRGWWEIRVGESDLVSPEKHGLIEDANKKKMKEWTKDWFFSVN